MTDKWSQYEVTPEVSNKWEKYAEPIEEIPTVTLDLTPKLQPHGMVFLPSGLLNDTTPVNKPATPSPKQTNDTVNSKSLWQKGVDFLSSAAKFWWEGATKDITDAKKEQDRYNAEVEAKKVSMTSDIKQGKPIETEQTDDSPEYQDPIKSITRLTGVDSLGAANKLTQLGYSNVKGKWEKSDISKIQPEALNKELQNINTQADKQLQELNKQIAITAKPETDRYQNNPRLANIAPSPVKSDPKLLAQREELLKDINNINKLYAEDYTLKNSEGMKPEANVTATLNDEYSNIGEVNKNLSASTDFYKKFNSGSTQDFIKLFQTKAVMYKTVGQDDKKRQGWLDYINDPKATYKGFSASTAEMQKMIYDGAKYDKASLTQTINRDQKLLTQVTGVVDEAYAKLNNKNVTYAPSDMQKLENLSNFAKQLKANIEERQKVVDRIDNIYETQLKDYVDFAEKKDRYTKAVDSSLGFALLTGAVSPIASIPRALSQFGTATALKLSDKSSKEKEALSHVIFDTEVSDIKPDAANSKIFNNGVNWTALMYQSGKVFTESMVLGGTGALTERGLASLTASSIEKATLNKELATIVGANAEKYMYHAAELGIKGASSLGLTSFGYVAPSILMFSPEMMKVEMDNKGMSFEDAYKIGMLRGAIEGVTERLNPLEMDLVKRAFSSGRITNFATDELYSSLQRGTFRRMTGSEMSDMAYHYIFNPAWKFTKEALTQANYEALEEEIGLLMNNMLDVKLNANDPKYKIDNEVTVSNVLDTYLTTLATMFISSGMAGYNKVKDDFYMQKLARLEAASNPNVFKARILDNLDLGIITKEEAIRQVNVVNKMAMVYQTIQPEIQSVISKEDSKELQQKKVLDLFHNELKTQDVLERWNTNLLSEEESNKVSSEINELQKEREEIKKQKIADSQNIFGFGQYDDEKARQRIESEVENFEEYGGNEAAYERYKRARAIKDQSAVNALNTSLSDDVINSETDLDTLKGTLMLVDRMLGTTEADNGEGVDIYAREIKNGRRTSKSMSIPVVNELLDRRASIEARIKQIESTTTTEEQPTKEEPYEQSPDDFENNQYEDYSEEDYQDFTVEPAEEAEEAEPENSTETKVVDITEQEAEQETTSTIQPTAEGVAFKLSNNEKLTSEEANFYKDNIEEVNNLVSSLSDVSATEPIEIQEPEVEQPITNPTENNIVDSNIKQEEPKALNPIDRLPALPPMTTEDVTKENKVSESTLDNNIAVNLGLKLIDAVSTGAYIGREVNTLSIGQSNYNKSLEALDNSLHPDYIFNQSAKDLLPGDILTLKLIPQEEALQFEKQAKETFRTAIKSGEKHLQESDENNENYFRMVGAYDSNGKLRFYVHDLSYIRGERIAHESPVLSNNLKENYESMKKFRDKLIPMLKDSDLTTTVTVVSVGHLSFDVDINNYVSVKERFSNKEVINSLQISDGTVYDENGNPTVNNVKSGRAIVLLPTKTNQKFALVLKPKTISSSVSNSVMAAMDIFISQNKPLADQFMKKYNLPARYNILTGNGLKSYLNLFINVGSYKSEFYGDNWKELQNVPFIDLQVTDNTDGTSNVQLKWSKQRVQLGDKISQPTVIRLTDKNGKPNTLAKAQFEAFQAFINTLSLNVDRYALSNFRNNFKLPTLGFQNNKAVFEESVDNYNSYADFLSSHLSTNVLEHSIVHSDNSTEYIYFEQPNIKFDIVNLRNPELQNQPVEEKEEDIKEEYKGLKIINTKEIPTSKHVTVGARAVRYKDGENKGKVQYILINKDALKEKFENKSWLEPVLQKDNSKATPLPENSFKDFNEFYNFVLEHEYQHDILGPKLEDENIGEYEDRVNQAALKSLTNKEIVAEKESKIESEVEEKKEEPVVEKVEESPKPIKKKKGSRPKFKELDEDSDTAKLTKVKNSTKNNTQGETLLNEIINSNEELPDSDKKVLSSQKEITTEQVEKRRNYCN